MTLLSGELPDKCSICMKLLKDAGFQMEAFMLDTDPATTTLLKDKAKEKDSQEEAQEIQDSQDPPEDQPDQAEDAPGPAAVLALVEGDPHLQLLQENSMKRRYPVRCLRCVRQCSRKNAVFDLITLKKEKYYWQHVRSPTHRTNVAIWNLQQQRIRVASNGGSDPDNAGNPGQTQDLKLMKCQGFSIQQGRGSKIHDLQSEFKLWMNYNSASALACARQEDSNPGHTYKTDLKKNDHVIIHSKCAHEDVPVAGGERAMCAKCKSLGSDRGISRMICRFYLKHVAARALAVFSWVWVKPSGLRYWESILNILT